jgi:5-(carboxyamino)imidazole ribonucleotide mutase
MDSLMSIVQMPAGIPVATVSIAGAKNAGLLAVRILGAADETLRDKLTNYQVDLERMVTEKDANLRYRIAHPD